MACEIIRDDTGKIIGIACGSPWGIGTYYHCHKRRCFCGGQAVYGFPPKQMNPEDFTPDPESCTEQELVAHAEALTVWHEAHK